MTKGAQAWVLIMLTEAHTLVLSRDGWATLESDPEPLTFPSNRVAKDYARDNRIWRSCHVLPMPTAEDGAASLTEELHA